MTAADALERADRRAFLLRRIVAGAEGFLIVAAFIVTFVSGVIAGSQREHAATIVAPIARPVAHAARTAMPTARHAHVRVRAHSHRARVIVRTVTRVNVVVFSLSLPELHVMRATLAIEPIAVRAVAPLPSSHSP